MEDDKDIVDELLANAKNILEAAGAATNSGCPPSDMTILIDFDGTIHIFTGSDWSLESLEAHHGARMAYRVTGSSGRIRVEGRSRSRSCILQTEAPRHAAYSLLRACV
jgi:hypothetical protein